MGVELGLSFRNEQWIFGFFLEVKTELDSEADTIMPQIVFALQI